jgi:flagellar biosynthesis/type III secretory pathway M-ring protein FliF/YscJ
MQPKIDRITATVMVDGASEEELAAVAGIVKGAIGIDESRLDNIFVTGLPWNHKVWEEAPEPAAAVAPAQDSHSLLWEALALGTGMFLLGLVGAGLLSKRVNPLLGVTVGSSESHNGINGIVDHGSNKNGQTTHLDVTASNGNRMEALENLVTSKPESVASLLRTTWLKH